MLSNATICWCMSLRVKVGNLARTRSQAMSASPPLSEHSIECSVINGYTPYEPAVAAADTELINNSTNGGGDSSFASRLACFRWHDDGASVGMIGERSLPEAITSHSSIKQERLCSIRAGNGRRMRLSRLGILRVGVGGGRGQNKRDC